jgi:hypothetical protein
MDEKLKLAVKRAAIGARTQSDMEGYRWKQLLADVRVSSSSSSSSS